MIGSGGDGVCKESLLVVLAEDNRTPEEGVSISYNERGLDGGQHTLSKSFRSMVLQQLHYSVFQYRGTVKKVGT